MSTRPSCETTDNQWPCGAQQKAQHARKILALDDRRLARLIEVWSMLSEDVKAAVAKLAGDDADDLAGVMAMPDAGDDE